MPPSRSAGPRRPRLLVDIVTRPRRAAGPARVARQRPGCPRGIGNACAHGQPEVGALGLDLAQKGHLSAEEMRAAREVHHQPLGRLLGHPGRKLSCPAPEPSEKHRLGHGVLQAGDEPGAHCLGVAQGLARGQSRI